LEKGSLRELAASRTTDIAGRGGNPVHFFGVNERIDNAGLVPFEVSKRRAGSEFGPRLGNLGRGGRCFRGVNGVPWLLTQRLVLLLAARLRVVDLSLDGRGRGLRSGWGEAAVRDEVFDRYDHLWNSRGQRNGDEGDDCASGE
jgi:hypothetical protein